MKVTINVGDGIWLWIDLASGVTYHAHVSLGVHSKGVHVCIGKQQPDVVETVYYVGNHDEGNLEFEVEQ